jgi:hypothetical protein
MDPDPRGPKICGSVDPDSNPDPQHCLRHYVRFCACCMLVFFPDIKSKLIDELESSNNPGKQCCGSGMFIPDPGFEFFQTGSRIQGKKILNPGFGSASKKLIIFKF